MAKRKDPTTTSDKATFTKLGSVGFYRLCKWLLEEYEKQNLRTYHTWKSVAEAATKALGFTVQPSSVTAARDELKLQDALAKPDRKAPGNSASDVQTLARYVQALYIKLGEPTPDGLREIAEGVENEPDRMVSR